MFLESFGVILRHAHCVPVRRHAQQSAALAAGSISHHATRCALARCPQDRSTSPRSVGYRRWSGDRCRKAPGAGRKRQMATRMATPAHSGPPSRREPYRWEMRRSCGTGCPAISSSNSRRCVGVSAHCSAPGAAATLSASGVFCRVDNVAGRLTLDPLRR